MPAELATTLTITEADRLLQAEALVRAYCGWHIAPSRAAVTYTVRTFGGRDIFLPSLYVTAVASITEADNPLTLDEEYEWLAHSGVIRRVGYWAYDEEVVVTFTHGYATVPTEITAVVQALARRAIDTPQGLASKTIGPFSESYVQGSLLEDERRILNTYRIPVLA